MNRFMAVAQLLHKDDSGQDLIEYALISALIGFACVAGMGTLSNAINTAFAKIGSKVTSNIN